VTEANSASLDLIVSVRVFELALAILDGKKLSLEDRLIVASILRLGAKQMREKSE
jgi:hypothetical protein